MLGEDKTTVYLQTLKFFGKIAGFAVIGGIVGGLVSPKKKTIGIVSGGILGATGYVAYLIISQGIKTRLEWQKVGVKEE